MGAVIGRCALVLGCSLLLASCGPPDRQSPDALVGHWLGNVSYRDATARLEFDVEQQGDSLVARFTSDELLIHDLPIGRFSYARPRVHFALSGPMGPLEFEGWLRRNLIVGQFHSRGFPNTERAALLPQLSLRHTYPSQFPYRVDTVMFAGSGDPRTGRLYTPRAQGPYPAVVIQPRFTADKAAIFQGYADRFARAGFQALVIGSGADPVAQASAAIRFLRAGANVDRARVGLVCFSPRAELLASVAAPDPPTFVVGVSPDLPDSALRGHAPHRSTVPLLLVFGARDALLDSPLAAHQGREVFHAWSNPDAAVRVFSRADHRIRLAPVGDEPFDWPRPAPGLVDTLVSWMRQRVR